MMADDTVRKQQHEFQFSKPLCSEWEQSVDLCIGLKKVSDTYTIQLMHMSLRASHAMEISPKAYASQPFSSFYCICHQCVLVHASSRATNVRVCVPYPSRSSRIGKAQFNDARKVDCS